MDKQKAISSFLSHLQVLSRLPLITGEEMAELYGEEVVAALGEMERYDREAQVCADCERRCCPAVRCELYAPQFARCPIHDFRPVICRLHFCNSFPITASPLIHELDDIFFESLLAAQRSDIEQARFFDCPPFTRIAPDFIVRLSPLVEGVRNGSLSPDEGERLILREVERYRSLRISM
ncbi:MAG: hypothetical protein HYX84_01695 [Chloroflexi bacterium]|nr:hypothetical protein [Chloroflexota bacterium]